MKSTSRIVVSDLTVSYNTRGQTLRVLDRISFAVEHGTTCCIVGPSGCGKSTLLRAILGLVSRESGTVKIDDGGRDDEGYGTAFVQQNSPLLPWRTALQNACLGAEIRGMVNENTINRVRFQLANLGLAGFEDALASELSGGMRQRVAVACALESKPAILFCDEPFSAVDFVGRLSLTTKFKNLCSNHHITTIFVTHNIEEAIFLGDVIFVMNGRPSRITAEHHPHTAVGCENAVESRRHPQFATLFKNIWQDLEEDHG